MEFPHRYGAYAAYVQAVISLATLVVAGGLVHQGALGGHDGLLQLALRQPALLLVQDGLKLVSAASLLPLLFVLYARLHRRSPCLVTLATAGGVLSWLLLFVSALLSFYLVLFADPAAVGELYPLVAPLGLAVIFFGGIWYLLLGLVALRHGGLPHRLARWAVALGALSLIPVLGLLVLVLSIPWWFWLGRELRAGLPATQAG